MFTLRQPLPRRFNCKNTNEGEKIRLLGKKTPERVVRDGLPECFPRLWRFCVTLTGKRELADDLAQMTCLRAIEKAHLFTPDTHLDRWLFVMARRVWLNDIRKNSITAAASFVSVDEMDVPSGNSSTETNIFTSEVFSEMNKLPEALRITALLVFVEGYKYREAAEILDVPVGTIMSRVSAARKTLAEKMLLDATGTEK